MTILVLCVFLVLALSRLLLAGQRRAGRDLLACAIAWAFVVGAGPLPHLLLRGLDRDPPADGSAWKVKNVVVVLGAGTVRGRREGQVNSTLLGYPRLLEGARLYRDCKKSAPACTLLLTGGDPRHNGISEAEVMRGDLVGIGIPEADILLEPKSNNTFQNAAFSSQIIRANAYDRVALVTSGTHLRRALKFFSHFRVDALGFPSEQAKATYFPIPLAQNFSLADLAIHEYLGLLRYQVYELFGWNSAE